MAETKKPKVITVKAKQDGTCPDPGEKRPKYRTSGDIFEIDENRMGSWMVQVQRKKPPPEFEEVANAGGSGKKATGDQEVI